MSKQSNALFLEEWLRSMSGCSSSFNYVSSPSSARAIIQAWSELRDLLQHKSFRSHYLQSLNTLVGSRASLHVADPQAKLVLSILSSPDISLPHESYPLLLRLLYVWARKSTRPSLVLIDSAVQVLSHIFSAQFDYTNNFILFSGGVLLLGSLSFVRSVSNSSKSSCLELLCRLLEEGYQVIGSYQEIVPDVLAGIGYALSSSVTLHFARILDSLVGIWGKEGGPQGNVTNGLMVLHLVEWVMSSLINSRFLEKINIFAHTLETSQPNYVPFGVVMAAAGSLRILNKSVGNSLGLDIKTRLRISAEDRIEYVARYLISRTRDYTCSDNDNGDSICLQCLSLALARSGPVSSRAPFFTCLASALLTEVFPLRRIYANLLKSYRSNEAGLRLNEIKEHLDSVLFKEAGVITSVLCNLYVSVDEESQIQVENLIWSYCRQIYLEQRQIALLLRSKKDDLLGHVEKIAESVFLMVVFFALAVTKHKLNSKFNHEMRSGISVQILVSFSCMEYFRRIRLSEYMDTIRGVAATVQEDDFACVSFVESMPTYGELTNGPGMNLADIDFSSLSRTGYKWSADEVQTARILFYLRIIPTCIEWLPSPVFRKIVAPTMFLYIGHPNEKVARASHSMFVAFISSGRDSEHEENGVSLKEQLVFYYIQRSLEGYPGVTPFEGMASGVVALVRHLPAGSSAIFYCIHCLVEKANILCRSDFNQYPDMWKNWQGESEPCKKFLDLLLRLISLVDVQVLPDLMRLLAQLIVQLPEDGQTLVLNELYTMVAESDDVTRKPTLVSWLQSLSYLCFQAKNGSKFSITGGSEQDVPHGQSTDSSNSSSLYARL